MRRRLRLTGFARFFIVMMFVIPLAYLGASYYRGEDGIQNIKKLLGIGKEHPQQDVTVSETPDTPGQIPSSVTPATASTSTLNARVEKLEQENRELSSRIDRLELDIKALKAQMPTSKKSGNK